MIGLTDTQPLLLYCHSGESVQGTVLQTTQKGEANHTSFVERFAEKCNKF